MEGSPQVIKEALACGCPIVATDVGDVRERTEGVDGCYVCAPVSEDLSDGLQKALASSERTKGAERIVKDRLDALSISKRIAEIYETVKKRS
jgi:glycosyltransferase involved in cell wall biosynthesis